MAVTPIEIINVGGLDYPVQDNVSRQKVNQLASVLPKKPHIHAFIGNEETTGNYQYTRAANSPFIWSCTFDDYGLNHYPDAGCLMMTTQPVTKGTQIIRGVNCTQITTIEQMAGIRMDRQGNAIYMVDWTGRSIYQGQFAVSDIDNNYYAKNKFIKTHNVTNGNFDEAQLEVGQTQSDFYNQGGRAAIAFHNHSVNACQIYLDANGDLQYLGSNGVAKRIVMES